MENNLIHRRTNYVHEEEATGGRHYTKEQTMDNETSHEGSTRRPMQPTHRRYGNKERTGANSAHSGDE